MENNENNILNDEVNNEVSKAVKKVKRKAPKQVSFRLTEEEYAILKMNAENSNSNSISDYAKKLILKDCKRNSLVPKIAKEDSKEIIRQLNAIGNNINQVTKKLNSSSLFISKDEISAIKDLTADLKMEVRKVWQQLS